LAADGKLRRMRRMWSKLLYSLRLLRARL